MQRGRRIAFDVGSARIGVAICDPDAILATPLVRIDRDGSEIRNQFDNNLPEFKRLIEGEYFD